MLPLFEHIPAAMGDQQHQKAGEKRPNDHEVENGGASKEPRVDSTDAQILMQVKATDSYAIESIEGSNGAGSLLKVEDYGNSRKLNVYFNGSDFSDPTTVFQILKSVDKMANFVKYSRNDRNFYLAAEKDMEVQLRKLENPPEGDEYFFFIKKVNDECGPDSPVIFQSKKTGDYVHCSSDTGRVFMKKAVGNESLSDRETWFKLVDRLEPQDKLTSDVDSVDGSEVQKEATMNELNHEDKINSHSSLESASDTEKKNGDGDPREEALEEVANDGKDVILNLQDSKKKTSDEQKVVKPEEQGNGNLRENDSC